MKEYLLTNEAFLQKIRKIQGKNADYLVECSPTSTLKSVIKALHREKAHRVFIVDSKRRAVGVITQAEAIIAVFSK